MGHFLRSAFAAATLLVAAGAAQATPVLDQSNLCDGSCGDSNPQAEWQQQITAGVSGLLAGIEVYASSDEIGTVRIGVGSAFSVGPFLFSTTLSLNAGGNYIDTSASGIILTAGELFFIDESNGSGAGFTIGSMLYSGGDLWISNSEGTDEFTAGPAYSTMPFETFVDASAVPEPASMALLAAGFGALVSLRRRRH